MNHAFYLEYNGDLYYAGGYFWIIGNMIDMLNKDPNAKSFAFRYKNYINQRNWGNPWFMDWGGYRLPPFIITYPSPQ